MSQARAWAQRVTVVVLVAGCTAAASRAEDISPRAYREQIEADWILRDGLRNRPTPSALPGRALTTRDDAAGGCDGIKNGKWGFHTGSAENPWWQVDLGASHALGRVVVWNRCEAVAERASRLEVQLSDDGGTWRTVYRHDGTTFFGHTDGKPLTAPVDAEARFVRVVLPGTTYLHLDEIEVFAAKDPTRNLALHRPANQISASQWSRRTIEVAPSDMDVSWVERRREVLRHARRLAGELEALGVDIARDRETLERLESTADSKDAGDATSRQRYLEARWVQRRLTLAHPLVAEFRILFAKRVPGSFNHMSDQYIGWWSRPGGGIFTLDGHLDGKPRVDCVSSAFDAPGSFLRPTLSQDGRKVLFAWCRYYADLAAERNKLDKGNVPEDAFYHVFEMDVDGGNVRQLTHGKYDDFDARYLPDGRIVFLSTRRGQFVQCGRESASQTLVDTALPDVYVRCGGGPERPCVVYTLHTMDANGGDLCAISPFEMFEWTPSVAHDGTILYSRWDYVDRHNMPYMGLWSINPDGTNSRAIYANFSRTPHCTFEPRSIPNSRKIVFTASAHHSQTKGSLVLLDPAAGDEGAGPITRLTPEVPFPEAEGWPDTCYANPWPLSERFYLVAWGAEGILSPATGLGWARWHSVDRPANGMGLYLFDAAGNMELLYRDPAISSMYPIPLRPRPTPYRVADTVDRDGPQEGRFLLADVYSGLRDVEHGTIQSLRIVAVPAKTHPTMNFPNLGVTRDDPGKCVLGTVPVEKDGSAYFRVPAGVSVFFQALDARGMAVQTMRSATHVQPGQTLACIGCHESRREAPPQKAPLAALRAPSRIAVGPEGSWPLRFDRLVAPIIEKRCVSCHHPQSTDVAGRAFDLRADRAWGSLVDYGKPSLRDHVLRRYGAGRSTERACAASESRLLALLTAAGGHHGVELDAAELERLIVWMDTYAQRTGSFDDRQEARLRSLRQRHAELLVERAASRESR